MPRSYLYDRPFSGQIREGFDAGYCVGLCDTHYCDESDCCDSNPACTCTSNGCYPIDKPCVPFPYCRNDDDCAKNPKTKCVGYVPANCGDKKDGQLGLCQ